MLICLFQGKHYKSKPSWTEPSKIVYTVLFYSVCFTWLVGAKGGGTFSLVDLYQDVDAVNVFEISKLDSDDTALTSLSKYYVQGECVNRFSKFIANRFGSSSQIKIKTQELLADNSSADILGSGVIAYFIEKIVNPALHTNFNYLTDFAGDEEEIATGFANKLIYFQNTEG